MQFDRYDCYYCNDRIKEQMRFPSHLLYDAAAGAGQVRNKS